MFQNFYCAISDQNKRSLTAFLPAIHRSWCWSNRSWPSRSALRPAKSSAGRSCTAEATATSRCTGSRPGSRPRGPRAVRAGAGICPLRPEELKFPFNESIYWHWHVTHVTNKTIFGIPVSQFTTLPQSVVQPVTCRDGSWECRLPRELEVEARLTWSGHSSGWSRRISFECSPRKSPSLVGAPSGSRVSCGVGLALKQKFER